MRGGGKGARSLPLAVAEKHNAWCLVSHRTAESGYSAKSGGKRNAAQLLRYHTYYYGLCSLYRLQYRLYTFFILRRMGKNKAQAHHTSTYFHTRRVSIELSCFRNPMLAGVSFGSHHSDSVSCPYPAAQAAVYIFHVKKHRM